MKTRTNMPDNDPVSLSAPTQEPLDLGFGGFVARESRQRFLNKNGSFNVARTGLGFWSSLSPYHSLLVMSWRRFFIILILYYVGANLLFAFAYVLCGSNALTYPTNDASIPRFWQAFFFSVHTLATIGYGNVSPQGLAANIVVVVESLVGLLGFAFATGILFARFSRPTAKLLFSQQAIIAPYQGTTAFEFRIMNARQSQIINLEAMVLYARFESAGRTARTFDVLTLARAKVAFFPLHWTIVHPIDETSPLYGLTHEDLLRTDAEFLVLLTGIDETFSQAVHTRSSYKADEIVWHARFTDIFNTAPDSEQLTIDARRLDEIERLKD